MNARAVLFDIDGTLIDSNAAHAESWARAFEAQGHHVPVAAIRRSVGKGGDKLLQELVGLDAESPEGKAIAERHASLFLDTYLPRLEPFAGGRELVERLLEARFVVGVASSANGREVDALLKAARLDDLLPRRTSADDAERSKPDPDIVRAGLRKLHAAAADALFVGDTPWDVEAGVRAGVRVIAVRSGGWTTHELAGAVAVYDHLGHLARAFAHSPFCR